MPKVPADQVITSKLVTAKLFGHRPIARPRGLGDPTRINIWCRQCQRILITIYTGATVPFTPEEGDSTARPCTGVPSPRW